MMFWIITLHVFLLSILFILRLNVNGPSDEYVVFILHLHHSLVPVQISNHGMQDFAVDSLHSLIVFIDSNEVRIAFHNLLDHAELINLQEDGVKVFLVQHLMCLVHHAHVLLFEFVALSAEHRRLQEFIKALGPYNAADTLYNLKCVSNINCHLFVWHYFLTFRLEISVNFVNGLFGQLLITSFMLCLE